MFNEKVGVLFRVVKGIKTFLVYLQRLKNNAWFSGVNFRDSVTQSLMNLSEPILHASFVTG